METLELKEQRLDKWLNYSCLFKTRAQATKACESRRIKVNGIVAKPAKTVKPGDYVTVKNKKGKFFNFTIISLTARNVSAKDAKNMYELEEQKISDEKIELLEYFASSFKEQKSKFKGRPTKKQRRQLEKVKNQGL
ncbi:RNA-binding S4 domain-containing protein [candidate division KSB1 bacterium]|nr:RNA-binding S4 domain-containing protein [candidate division KSB1 bacterium]